MRRFEILIILVFLQIGTITTGFVELQPGKQLVSPYMNIAFGGSIIGLANGLTTFIASVQHLNIGELTTPQQFQICIPTFNTATLKPDTICTPSIAIPGVGIFNTLGSLLSVSWNLLILLVTALSMLVVGAIAFYAAILNTFIPYFPGVSIYVNALAVMIGLIQTTIVIIDIISMFSWSMGASSTYLKYDKGEKHK